MADYISLDTLMDTLNTDLNALSTTLLASSDISRAIPFNVVASIQDYEDDKTYSATAIVPGIGLLLSGTVAPSQVYKSYRQVVNIALYGFSKEVADMETVINEYISQNTGKFTKSDDWTYQLAFDFPSIINRVVDEGEERFTLVFDITYNFIFKGYTSDDITLKINNVEVPVITYTHTNNKEGITVQPAVGSNNTLTRNKVSTITKVIKFVHINETEINKIHEDIDTGNFLNRTYSVFYGLGSSYSSTVTMVLATGTIQYTEGGFLTLEGTFNIVNPLNG